MKYFGEFLVSKKIISEEILADILVEQHKNVPSVLEIVHKKRLVNASELLKALAWQTENQGEFKTALQNIQKWTPELETSIRTELETQRVPLGHLLIKKGVTDLVTITKALDEFLSRKEEVAPAATKAAAPSIVESISEPSSEPVITELKAENLSEPKAENLSEPLAAAPPLTEAAAAVGDAPAETVAASPALIDPILLEEFLGYLTEERLRELKALVEPLNDYHDVPDMVIPILKEVVVVAHSIKGLMRCIQIKKAEAMVNTFENAVVKALAQAKDNKVEGNKEMVQFGLMMIDQLGLLRQSLIQNKSEEPWVAQAQEFLKKWSAQG